MAVIDDETPVDPYANAVKDAFQFQTNRLKTSFRVAQDVTPDRQAEVINLSERSGIPTQAVQNNFDTIKERFGTTERDYAELVAKAPKLADWMAHPENAALGKDDAEPLAVVSNSASFVERSGLGDLGRSAEIGGSQLSSAAYALGAAYGKSTPEESVDAILYFKNLQSQLRAKQSADVQNFRTDLDKSQGKIDRWFAGQADRAQLETNEFIRNEMLDMAAGQAFTWSALDRIGQYARNPKGFANSIVENFVSSSPSIGAGAAFSIPSAMAGGAIAGPPGAAAGLAVGYAAGGFAGELPVEVANSILEDFDKRGINTRESMIAAFKNPQIIQEIKDRAERKGLTTASIDAVFNLAVGKNFAKAAESSLGKTAFKQATEKVVGGAKDVSLQAIGGGLSEGAGQLARGGVQEIDPNSIIDEAMGEIGTAVGETFTAIDLRSRLPKDPIDAAREMSAESARAWQHLNDAMAMKQIGDGVKASKLKDRVPAKIGEIVGPESKVYYQVDDFDQYWKEKGLNPEKAAEQLTGSKTAYNEAKNNNSPLEVNLADLASNAGPTEHYNDLVGISRSEPYGPSVNEDRAALKAVPEIMQALANEESGKDTEAFSAIKEDVKQQFINAGMPESQANQLADYTASGYSSLGSRLKEDPAALYQRTKPTILREGVNLTPERIKTILTQAQQQKVQFQTAYHASPFRFNKFDLHKVGSGAGSQSYGWGLYFSKSEEFTKYYKQQLIEQGKATEDSPIYQSDIPEDEDMIDWDKPVAEQSPKMQEVIAANNLPGETGEEIYKNQVKTQGSPEAASRYLSSLDVSGLKYRNTNADLVKIPTDSYVVFNDKLIAIDDILKQAGKDPTIPLGFYDPASREIAALKGANLSTYLHELSHHFMALMQQIAAQENAPQQIKDDFKTILDALGIKDASELTSEHQETMAEWMVNYFHEGKAPSIKLKRAFARFQTWLNHVYRHLRNLDVPLTDQVRGVFDRMLATDREIEEAAKELESHALFDNPENFGFTGENLTRYMEARDDALREAREELNAKALAALRREHELIREGERERIEYEVAADVNNRPEYIAHSILRYGTNPDGSELPAGMVGIKLDKAALKGIDGLPRGISEPDGVHPDVASQMLGFKTGQELINALRNLPDRKKLIKTLTDARLKAQAGDLLIDPDLGEEAKKAIHNKAREKLMRLELEHMASENLSVLGKVVQKIAKPLPTDMAIRENARRIVGRQRVMDIRSNSYAQAERRFGREAVDALLKGDFEKAFSAKLQQRLSHELYKEATQAEENVEDFIALAKNIFATSDKKLAEKRDVNLVKAARSIMAGFGMGKGEGSAAEHLEQMRKYDPGAYANIIQMVNDARTPSGNVQMAPYNDFLQMQKSVEALWQLSMDLGQLEVEGKKIDIDQAVAPLIDTLQDLTANKKRPRSTASDWEKAKVGLMGIASALRIVESWADSMGGKFKSIITDRIFDATTQYRLKSTEAKKKIRDIFKAVRPRLTWEPIAAPELNFTFKDKSELLMAILHRGNDSNFSKFLRGWKFGTEDENGNLNTTNWDNFEARMQREGVLTKEDYDFAQAIWDLFEELKPASQKAHKKMYGHYFDEITARPFQTPYGEYSGGYVPAKADVDRVTDAKVREELEFFEENNRFLFPEAPRGFTKKRVEKYAAPLSLELQRIPAAIDAVVRFAEIGPAVQEVGKILKNQNFKNALDDYDRTIIDDMLIPWLERTAKQQVTKPTGRGKAWTVADRIAKTMRRNSGLSVMFGNITNAMQQISGLSLSAVKVKPKYLRNSMAKYLQGPKDFADTVTDLSPYMDSLTQQQIANADEEINDILLKPSKFKDMKEFAQAHGYILQTYTQNVVNHITWAGAYDQAIAQGMDHNAAVKEADSVVRLTQGSSAAESVARFGTGSPVFRLFTMFTTYFNMQANLLATETMNTVRQMGLKNGLGRMLQIYAYGFLIPAFLSELIVKSMSGEIDEDDDDQYLDDLLNMFAGGTFRNATAMIPFVGPTLNAAVNKFNKKWYDDRISTSPVISQIESAVRAPQEIYAALAKGKQRKAAIRDTLTAIGLFGGIPTGQIAKTAGYLSDLEDRKVRPDNALELTQGLITGRGRR